MTENSVLLVGCQYGVYIPKLFAQHYEHNIVNKAKFREELRILKRGPSHPEYWEAWQDITDKAKVKIGDAKFTITQSDDLWAVPENELELICELQ